MNEKEITTKPSYDNGGDTHQELFNKSGYFEFLHKKSERIATAIYMVTSFIKDTDLVKLRMREKALLILSASLSLEVVPLLERKRVFADLESGIKEIISLINIGFRTNLISEMNHSVLKNELEIFNKEIGSDEFKENKDKTVSLSAGFFDIGQIPSAEDRAKFLLKDTNNRQNESLSREGFNKGQKTYLDHVKQGSFIKDNQNIRKFPLQKIVDNKKNERHDKIIDLLKKKDGLGIKDFAEAISGCSEKTIQRELLNMVESGAIRKEGDRRWSRYFIV